MSPGRRVLVVDGLAETEEVLRAVLEPRGLEVRRVRADASSEAARQKPPHLLVLHHVETPPAPKWGDVPRVIIGRTARRRDRTKTPAAAHYLPHPFEYGDLIAAIERLLAGSAGSSGGERAAYGPNDF